MLTRTFNRFGHLLEEAGTGLRRAGWMNWLAVTVLAVLLYLLGLGWQGVWYLEQGLVALGSQLEVAVYLKPSSPGNELLTQARHLTGVAQVELITRDQAWENLRQEQNLPKDFTSVLGDNPLVDVLHLKIATPDQVQTVARLVKQWPEVAEVRYGSEAAQRLEQVKQALSSFGLAVLVLLAGVAVVVIMTTIGLIVASRQKEIEVMQLVGATPIWVYFPFMIEGLLLGLVGAGLAWSLIRLTDTVIHARLVELLPFIPLTEMDPDPWQLPLLLGATGLSLGITGSWLAVVRYLKR